MRETVNISYPIDKDRLKEALNKPSGIYQARVLEMRLSDGFRVNYLQLLK
jgi:hypothetical protein